MNANVIYDDNGVIRLGTFKPFDFNTCAGQRLINFGVFSNGSFNLDPSREIFPNKLRNLYQCPVRTGLFQSCPAVCIQLENKGTRVRSVGYDIAVMQLVSRKLNFNFVRKLLFGEEQWGRIYPNGSTTGAIDKIVKEKYDVIIGNLFLRTSHLQLMDSSVVYFASPLVLAIPLGEQLTPFEKLLRPFDSDVWLVMGLVLVIGVLIVLIINWKFEIQRALIYGTGVNEPITNILIAVFGLSQTQLPEGNFARLLLMTFLLFCLVVRNVYLGLLYNYMQSDGRHREVQSIDEMHEKGFEFIMYESFADIIQSQSKIFDK